MSKQTPKSDPKPKAKSRTVTVTREELDEDVSQGEAADQGYELDPTEEALEALFTEARGHDGVEIRVYKLDPENRSGARAYAMAVSLQDADSGRLMDILQRKWKGGEFELVARAEGRILKRTVVTVMPLPEPETPPAMAVQESVAAAITAAMAPMNETLRALSAPRPGFDFEALLNKLPLLLAGFAQAKQLFAPPAAPVNPMDPMAGLMQFAKIKEVMDSLGMTDAKPSAGATAMTMFKEFGGPLLDALKAGQVARPAPRAARPPVMQNSRVVPMTRPVTVTAPAMSPAMPDEMGPIVALLSSAAKSGETPESVAQRLTDFLTDEQVNKIADALEGGALVALLKARPEFAGQAFWIDSVAKSFLEGLDSGEPDDPLPADGLDDVPEGDGADIASHDHDGDS